MRAHSAGLVRKAAANVSFQPPTTSLSPRGAAYVKIPSITSSLTSTRARTACLLGSSSVSFFLFRNMDAIPASPQMSRDGPPFRDYSLVIGLKGRLVSHPPLKPREQKSSNYT